MSKEDNCKECRRCTQRTPIFELLSEEELRLINRDRYSVWFHDGEIILKQGTPATTIVSVVDGFVKKYLEGLNDRKLVLDFVKSRQLVGSPGAHNHGTNFFGLVSIGETLVCFLDANKLIEIIGLNGAFAKAYVAMCSGNYGRSLERMVSLGQKQIHGRVADALIYLSEEIYESEWIGCEIKRQDIADYTSMSKDSAIRILKEFERDEIIHLEGNCVKVLDPKRLRSISKKG